MHLTRDQFADWLGRYVQVWLEEFSDVFVCRFDDQGQCAEFHEWWMRAPGPVARLD